MDIDIQALMNEYTPVLIDFGIRLLTAIGIFVVGRYIAGLIVKVVRGLLQKQSVDPTVEQFIGSLLKSLLMVMVVVVVLTQLGIETASLIAVLGAAGLAVGLALQGSLANFASGVLLIVLRPCKAGDYIDAGGSSGTVEKIDILATTLVTPDNKVVVIPNSSIMGGAITNYSAKNTRRIDLELGVGYDADLNQVKTTVMQLLEADSRVLKTPAPTVEVVTLADSSVNFVVRPWVATSDYWGTYFDLQKGMKEAMDKAGINIPYPQVDVHMPEKSA